MFSEVKITETYCMANDFYKDLYCNRKNIWSKLVYFINGSGGVAKRPGDVFRSPVFFKQPRH